MGLLNARDVSSGRNPLEKENVKISTFATP
jgi:hypothetical protein